MIRDLIIAAVLIVIFSAVAHAAPTPRECSDLSWDAVTTNTEGGIIVVDGYRLYTVPDGTQIGDTTALSMAVLDMLTLDGNYEVVATAYKDALESAYSNSVNFKIVGGVPMRIGIPGTPSFLSIICP